MHQIKCYFAKKTAMKSVSLIFNIVLLVFVGVLFYLHFSSDKKVPSIASAKIDTTTGQQMSDADCKIAYFDIDSITNSFVLWKNVQSELTAEESKMSNELARMQKMYNDKLSYYQNQAQTKQMTQVQSEQANKDILQLQDELRGRKQDMDQKYQDLVMRRRQEVKDKIESFLKEYNKTRGYSYIFAYEPGFMYYRDTAYNITADLLKGLNEQYGKKK